MNPNPATCADPVHRALYVASLFIEGRGAADLGSLTERAHRNDLPALAH